VPQVFNRAYCQAEQRNSRNISGCFFVVRNGGWQTGIFMKSGAGFLVPVNRMLMIFSL